MIKKMIQTFLSKFGFEIIRLEKNLPSRQTLFANFSSMVTAYQRLFQQNEKIKIKDNPLRTMLLARGMGTRPPEAYYILKALEQTQNICGDICEFGVAQGETSALIANEIRGTNKNLHLFDSFQGLPNPTANDTLKDDMFSLGNISAYHGAMAFPKSQVESRLLAIDFPSHRYLIHEGFIEQILESDDHLPEKVAFAYVDLDLYEPIKLALDFLNSRTEQGAIIIVDDYDFFSTGIRKAVDEFILQNTQYHIYIPPVEFGHFAILEKYL